MEQIVERAIQWVAASVGSGIHRLRERFADRTLVAAGVLLALTPVAVAVLRDSGSPVGDPAAVPQVFDVVPTTSTTQSTIIVHVAGAVRSPGLYRLSMGSRVADAIEAAGGVDTGVDIDRVNLAAPLVDGTRIHIAHLGEPIPDPAVPAAGMVTTDAATGPLDLNTANQQQLETLPGVGPSTAAAILDQRRKVGRFSSVEDLLEVRGIGEAKLDQLRALVRVH